MILCWSQFDNRDIFFLRQKFYVDEKIITASRWTQKEEGQHEELSRDYCGADS
jgi:hypothetical protein